MANITAEALAAWQARNDGPGAENARWATVIEPLPERDDAAGRDLAGSVVVQGFASDEGVRRNQGRPGAGAAPDTIRGALASLAVHRPLRAFEAGTVTYPGRDLEAGQEELSARVAGHAARGALTVVLGGGHDTAFASHRGLQRVAAEEGKSIGILNLDAHFDLREEPQPTSGTPFRQIAGLHEEAGSGFHYAVAGISPANNTKVLFDTADRLGVDYLTDDQVADADREELKAFVERLAEGVDALHLSIDMDVLPAAVAPGVSAPAAVGVELARIRQLVAAAAETGKLTLVDVVEVSPRFDIDGRTAKVAARLVDDIVARLPRG
ncbi:formimidoylglutamase [Corynebacterium otitidis]|uniref:formimidoylglutamase n=1 Tax=Corynebacterium otitidis TaxID=29321 RepID=UPI0006279F7E|nr:formimidoylglutamase [Corynebacterium otitidis]KKO83744.1 formimidoylglutamase [Corynebacterium otitidis]